MQILLSAWISASTVVVAAAERFRAFLAWAPESWVLVIWGALLLLAAQLIRHHVGRQPLPGSGVDMPQSPATAGPALGAPAGRPWNAGIAVVRR